MTDVPTELTRDELYQQVWSEPMWTLAKRYGLSDVGLKKVCERLRVPTPWRGYWRKREVGKTARRTPLPKLPDSAGEEQRRFLIRQRSARQVTLDPNDAVGQRSQFEEQPENRISVPEVLENPHALIAQTVLALRKAKPDEQGILRLGSTRVLDVRVTISAADRAMRILDALVKALDDRGFAVSAKTGGGGTVASVLAERVPFYLQERVQRVERKPPAKRSSRDPSEYTPSYAQYDSVPSGQLMFRFDHAFLDGTRVSWSDGKQQRLEDCLNKIIVGFVRVAEAIKAQRLQQEVRERERREEEKRRAAEQEKRWREEARVRVLDQILAQREKSLRVRRYVTDARASREVEPGSLVDRWLDWAEEYAGQLYPLHGSFLIPSDESVLEGLAISEPT